jgi:formyl-CoA transferase
LNTVPEVLALAQVAALAMFSRPYADTPTLFHGLPISFDGQRAGDESRAPRIGEHNGAA